MNEQKPKMIIFDYGNTLVYESELNLQRAYTELYKHISKNPQAVSVEDFVEKGLSLIDKIIKQAIPYDIEIKHSAFFKTHFDSLNIKFDLPFVELEMIFWEALAPCSAMPEIKNFLLFLKEQNIRTAVVSNISFSEEALTKRINKYIPENNFEFIIASSEYGFRKPDKILFEIALKKAGLNPEEVWYCGDNLKADVLGSSSVGIKPVLFKNPQPCPYNNDADTIIDFEFLTITKWSELKKFLEEL